jgi:HSP20 family protein
MDISFKSYEDMFDELDRELRQLSDETFMHFFRLPNSEELWQPRVDVYETATELVVKVCAAGLKPKDLDVSLSADNRHLTVRGSRGEPRSDRHGRIRYYLMEIYFGPFERIIQLPANVRIDRDRLHAVYNQGFLKIVLPKLLEDDSGVRKIVPVEEEES